MEDHVQTVHHIVVFHHLAVCQLVQYILPLRHGIDVLLLLPLKTTLLSLQDA